jgi:ABC-type lipoprotein release transport system permease subunit
MSTLNYILASLWQYRRIHLSVAAGVVIAGAVITGALLVGDSMRGSLRGLALDGLGRIDAMVVAEHPFRVELADELIEQPGVAEYYSDAHALLMTAGVATFRSRDVERRATNLSVAGVPEAFWTLAINSPSAQQGSAGDSSGGVELSGNQIALTINLAEELQVEVGDTLLLRIPVPGSVPADSTLGDKEDASASRRLEVAAVLDEHDDKVLARFSLRPNQRAPRNAFVPLSVLQSLVDLPGRANAIAVAVDVDRATEAAPESARQDLIAALRPQLSDFGLKVEQLPTVG